MGAVDLAAMDAVEHLERMHDRAADQIVDLEAATGHRVDALDIVLRHFIEDVFRAPRTLHLQGHGLRARDLRHCNCGGAGGAGGQKEFAATWFSFFQFLRS